jgi:hypothetical protein
MSEDFKGLLLYLGMLGAVLGFFGGLHVLHSSYEAAAYTRLTGKQVTTWDAMFLDLRVQESIQD